MRTRGWPRILLAVLVITGSACSVPASAEMIGSDLTPAIDPTIRYGCEASSTSCIVLPTTTGGSLPASSPITGIVTDVIVSAAAKYPHTVKLVGLHPAADGRWTVTWTTTLASGLDAGINRSVADRRTMAAGDTVGLYIIDPKNGDVPLVFAPVAGAEMLWEEQEGPGNITQLLSTDNVQLQLQADISADIDGDGFARDDCPKDPTRHTAPCPVDVQVTQSLSASAVSPGGAVASAATVRNNGPSDARGLVHWKVGGVGGAHVTGCSAGNAAQQAEAHCNFSLDPGEAKSFTIFVHAPPHAASPSAGQAPLSVAADVQLDNRAADTVPANNVFAATLEATWPDEIAAVSLRSGPSRIRRTRLRESGLAVVVRAAEAANGRVTLQHAGRTLGATRFSAVRPGTVTRHVRLNALGRRALRSATRHHRSLRLRVVMTATDSAGNRAAARGTVTAR